MTPSPEPLPIDDALPDLLAALATGRAAVIVAPPGAGKTTRVPLLLAQQPWVRDRKILILEPRRLAARAAAERMAHNLGQQLGDVVGLRVRFGSKVSRKTRVEVVTEGVFTRLILDDPGLDGVAAVLFDEFHERSLDGDLGFALARDVQLGLREDLKILVMSATIDGARVSSLLGGAPVIESKGRAFPVETRYIGRDTRTPIEKQVADIVAVALRAESGSVLAFLPGAAEIRRAERLLKERVGAPSVDVVALYGALERGIQDLAIAPAAPGHRKVVLATSIAETSITIEGVRIIIDSGLARVPRYEPDVGLTRLETIRVSRASADQRRGRAGRTEAGVCYRLWDEPQTASLEAFSKPEILTADLSSLVLDLAEWGVTDPGKLAFPDQPPRVAIKEARDLLLGLDAVDAEGKITNEGRALRKLPLPPRLARMVMDAAAFGHGRLAAEIAVILTERGLGGDDPDLRHRLETFRGDRSQRADQARRMSGRWNEIAQAHLPDRGRTGGLSSLTTAPGVGALLAMAYPDRIACHRGAGIGAFVLANGRGAALEASSALAREPWLAVGDLTGTAAQGRILTAAPISSDEINALFETRIEHGREVTFDADSASMRARRKRRLGALTLSEQPEPVIADQETAGILARGLARLGMQRLPWTKTLVQWRSRVMFLRANEGDEWPDLSDRALTATSETWLASALTGVTALADFSSDDFGRALTGLLPWPLRGRLDAEAPTHFEAPTGSRIPIDYESEGGPKVSVRVQELFGLDSHPTIAGGRVPVVLELLSPAHRPVQLTRDLPGFWRGSYAAVKSEMRGRYPKHPWPDNPLSAPATRRAKPRGT